jgi:hypothetical protein
MVARNTIGIGINEDPLSLQGNTLYDFMSRKAVSQVLERKSIPYLDRNYADKRRILREYSIKDEIRDFVSTVADEAIVYSDKDFCKPTLISSDYPQEIRDKYLEHFERIYNRFGFADSISAWNMMKDFLIDGYVAVEIVWDDKNKNIISFQRLRPDTLVPAYEPSIGKVWIQFPEDPMLRRIFLDTQIIFISYSSQNDYGETSYVEGLIKPYNQVKILEQTRIMFNVINATLYQKFVIPTKGLGQKRAEQALGQLIHDYSEQIEFDDTLGTVRVSGMKHLPYNKQFWFPDGDHGTPQMELISPQGHDLNEDGMLKWFFRVLQRASKIPALRFQDENGGGNIFADAAEITHDESKFSNFIQRLRAIFKEIITKPLKLQMLVEFPELKGDEKILNQMDIEFLSNQLFEEWKKLGNMQKRGEVMSNLLGIQDGDRPYFHIEYLVDHILKLSPEEKEENKRYWLRDKLGAGAADVEGGEGGEGGDFGGDTGGDIGGDVGGDVGGDTGGDIGGDVGGDVGGEETGGGDTGGDTGGEFEF